MGGVILFLVSDFRKTLPVITQGPRADQINACMKKPYFWDHIKKIEAYN